MTTISKKSLILLLAAVIVIFSTAETRAQDASRSEAKEVRIPSKVKLSGQRTTHPGAQWFSDAGLGLFMHWGIPSAHPETGNSWSCFVFDKKPDWLNEPYRSPNDFWDLAKTWNPPRYDPDKWLKAAKAAGFEYAVLTSKPHLGYVIWPSKFGEMSTQQHMNGRDLIKPYVEACRKNDMKVGFYFSGTDWYFDREYMNFHFGRSEASSGKRKGVFLNYKH